MTIETARKIKELGFIQSGKGTYYFMAKEDSLYVPELSELIEACGDGYFKLVHPIGKWCAQMGLEENLPWYEGSTPEEAVAKLWIKLNKK